MHPSDINLFCGSFYLLLMKKKNIKHPKFYSKIIETRTKYIIVEYIDNEFDKNLNRKIKRKRFEIDKSLIILSEFLNKLNQVELEKLDRFIEVQNKAMNYHKKKNNIDSHKTIKGSIKLMNDFKGNFK